MSVPHKQTLTVTSNGRGYHMAAITHRISEDWIVFVHGWGGCKDCFDEVFSREEFSDMSICTVDLLGFGESDRPRDFSYDLSDQAKLLALAIKSLKPHRVSLIGHSMGGGVGLLAAPLLGDTLQVFVSAEGSAGVPTGSLALRGAALPYWVFASFVWPLMELSTKFALSRKLRLTGDWLRQSDIRALYRSAQSLQVYSHNVELLSALAKLPRRIYVCGEKSKRLQKVAPHIRAKGIDVAVIPHTGHTMMLDNPDDFYRTIAEVIQE